MAEIENSVKLWEKQQQQIWVRAVCYIIILIRKYKYMNELLSGRIVRKNSCSILGKNNYRSDFSYLIRSNSKLLEAFS
jgi:hypothetical protein